MGLQWGGAEMRCGGSVRADWVVTTEKCRPAKRPSEKIATGKNKQLLLQKEQVTMLGLVIELG